MDLVSAFEASAIAHAQKTAVFWGDLEISFQALQTQILGVTETLRRDFRIQPGDRVGIWLKNCPQFIPAIFGILRCGAIAIPINNFLKPAEVGHIVADAGINVMITDAAFLEQAGSQVIAQSHALRFFRIEDFPAAPKAPESPDCAAAPLSDSDLALIIYTSGTTGKSKGAMITHGNLLHNVNSCREVLKTISHDRFALLLPMFHSFMICVCVMLPLLTGGSIVLIKSLHPAKMALQEMIMRQSTILPAIPQFFRALIDAHIPMQLPMRLCISGAAPLPVQVLRDFSRKFNIPLIEGYGLSEASPVVALNPPNNGAPRERSIGLPIANVEVTIQDDKGRIMPDGQTGELCVRGGNVMKGYWKQPEATAQALRNGWLLTGDVGYKNSDGYIYITDRKKDMLLVNGINVYPREIEEVLYQFVGVKEAAVVGQPDSRKGEQPVAFVSLQEGVALDQHSLTVYLRKNLADYKVPRRIYFMPELPRNSTGKVLKTVLRQMQPPIDGRSIDMEHFDTSAIGTKIQQAS